MKPSNLQGCGRLFSASQWSLLKDSLSDFFPVIMRNTWKQPLCGCSKLLFGPEDIMNMHPSWLLLCFLFSSLISVRLIQGLLSGIYISALHWSWKNKSNLLTWVYWEQEHHDKAETVKLNFLTSFISPNKLLCLSFVNHFYPRKPKSPIKPFLFCILWIWPFHSCMK